MTDEHPVIQAFEKALQGECNDIQDGSPHLTFYFNPGDLGCSSPYKFGAVHRLSVAFGTAVFPMPTGYLPAITADAKVLGYGKTPEDLVYLKFTYDGLSEEIDGLMKTDRFLCHLAAAQVVKLESSSGQRVSLRDVRFKTENMNPNENAPALI